MSNNMRIPLRHLSTVLFGSSHLRHCQEGSIVGCRSPLPGSHRYRNQQHGSFHGCLSLCTSHSSSFSSSSSSSSSLQSVEVPPTRTTVLEEENSVSVVEDHRPFFRIYYNDVYEVPLPPKHRFPMKKYVQVRKQIQQWISDLSEDEKNRINCGTSRVRKNGQQSSPPLFFSSGVSKILTILSFWINQPKSGDENK